MQALLTIARHFVVSPSPRGKIDLIRNRCRTSGWHWPGMVQRFEDRLRDRAGRLESSFCAIELATEVDVTAGSLQIHGSASGQRSFDLINDFAGPVAAHGPKIDLHI